jgi:hypothetical protein
MSADRSNHTGKSQNKETNQNKDVRNNSCSWREMMERCNIKIQKDLYLFTRNAETCALRKTLK